MLHFVLSAGWCGWLVVGAWARYHEGETIGVSSLEPLIPLVLVDWLANVALLVLAFVAETFFDSFATTPLGYLAQLVVASCCYVVLGTLQWFLIGYGVSRLRTRFIRGSASRRAVAE